MNEKAALLLFIKDISTSESYSLIYKQVLMYNYTSSEVQYISEKMKGYASATLRRLREIKNIARKVQKSPGPERSNAAYEHNPAVRLV